MKKAQQLRMIEREKGRVVERTRGALHSDVYLLAVGLGKFHSCLSFVGCGRQRLEDVEDGVVTLYFFGYVWRGVAWCGVVR